MPDKPFVLILGGTGDARRIAERLDAAGVDVLTSLAGRTDGARRPPGRLRVGGFGGETGLTAWLRAERPACVVDATHPFAVRMSAHAAAACAVTGLARVALVRPPWQPRTGDRWIEVADAAEAAARLPEVGTRALLTVGSGDLGPFAAVRGVEMTARVVTPPVPPVPNLRLLIQRGPFAVAAEAAVFDRLGIDVLVTKASGGAATAPKLAVARARGIPVLVLRRPPPPPPPHAATVDEAVDRVLARVAPPGRGSG